MESSVVKAPITGIAPTPKLDHRGRVTEKLLDDCLTKHNGDRAKVAEELGVTTNYVKQKITYYRVLFHKWSVRKGSAFNSPTVEDNLEGFVFSHSACLSAQLENLYKQLDRIEKRFDEAERDPVNKPMSQTEYDSLTKAKVALMKEGRETVTDFQEILTERAKIKSKVRTPDRQGGKLPPMGATAFGPKGQTVVKIQNAVVSMNGDMPQLPKP